MPDVLFVVDGSVVSPVRMVSAHKELTRRGLQSAVISYDQMPQVDPKSYKTVIFQRPIMDMHDAFDACRAFGIRTVVDIDDDYSAIPKDHPNWQTYASPQPLSHWTGAIHEADVVTVASLELGRRLAEMNKNIVLVPNGWDDGNPRWWMTNWRQTVNIGFAGTSTHREDVKLCLPAMARVASENKDVKIVIGGDDWVYKRLVKLPESKKMFIPGLPYDDYPFMLCFMDILCVPLLDTNFTRAKSDIKLVDAGARGIPWAASLVEPYRNWPAGGKYANNEQNWYDLLSMLVKDEQLRQCLGEAGHEAALERTFEKISEIWMGILK